MLITTDSNCIQATEQQSQKLIAGWLDAAGLPENPWPLDRDDAGEVLAAAGYSIDGDGLRRLAWMMQVPDLEQWDARDLLAAASALEARRQWQPNSVHDPKKHPQMLLLEEMVSRGEAGVEQLRESFKNIDVRLALILLAEADNRLMRESMLTTVHALLAIRGIAI